MWAGACEGALAVVGSAPDGPGGWSALLERFAALRSGAALELRGNGAIASPAWGRAVAEWARTTYNELVSGQVSATGRTVASFVIPAIGDGPSRRLTVLRHGWAWIAPAEQPADSILAQGWLDTSEMEALDGFIRRYRPLWHGDEGYLDGRGKAEATEAQTAEVAAWASAVCRRLQREAAMTLPREP